MNREFKALQLSEEEKFNLVQLRAEKRELIQFILAGKAERQAELSGCFRHWLVATAYATVRPWELPNRPMCHNTP